METAETAAQHQSHVSSDLLPSTLFGHGVPLHIMEQSQWGLYPSQHHNVYHEGMMAFSPPSPPQVFQSHHAQITQANAGLLCPLVESSSLGTAPFSDGFQSRPTADTPEKAAHLSSPPASTDLEDLECSLVLDGDDVNEATSDGNVSEFLLSMLSLSGRAQITEEEEAHEKKQFK